MTTVDLNNAECIKDVNNIGNHVYHNICNGSTTVVGWGTTDWVCAVVLTAMVVLIIGMMGLMIHIVRN